MASIIQIKRSVASNTPSANSLQPGELAFSYSANALFIGDTSGGNIELFSNTSSSSAAYDQANTANVAAQTAITIAEAAFAEANTALQSNSNGHITGSLIIDGDINVSGNVSITLDGGVF